MRIDCRRTTQLLDYAVMAVGTIFLPQQQQRPLYYAVVSDMHGHVQRLRDVRFAYILTVQGEHPHLYIPVPEPADNLFIPEAHLERGTNIRLRFFCHSLLETNLLVGVRASILISSIPHCAIEQFGPPCHQSRRIEVHA